MPKNAIRIQATPPFDYSSVPTPNDSTDNCAGCVGIHNATDTSGAVKVTYQAKSSGADVDATLYLNSGDYLLVPIRRIWSTGTAVTTVAALWRVTPNYS